MPTGKLPNAFISPAEIARRIGMDPNKVRKMMQKGSFPVGFAFFDEDTDAWQYRIPRAEYERWECGELPSSHTKALTDFLAQYIQELCHE